MNANLHTILKEYHGDYVWADRGGCLENWPDRFQDLAIYSECTKCHSVIMLFLRDIAYYMAFRRFMPGCTIGRNNEGSYMANIKKFPGSTHNILCYVRPPFKNQQMTL